MLKPLPQVLTGTALRTLSLGVGVAANLLVLNWAYIDLGVSGFGALAVISNLSFAVQNVDLGVRPAFTNRASDFIGAAAMASREVFAWAFALLLASAAIGASTYGMMRASGIADLPYMILALALGLAALTNVFSLPYVALVGLGRIQMYYGLSLAQPFGLMVAGFCIHLTSPSLATYSVAIVASASLPGVAALCDQSLRRRVARLGGGRVRLPAILARSAPLAVRQVTAMVAFGLVPAFAAVVGGPVLAAQYAIPFRIFIAVWSVVGVVYMSRWSEMARAASIDAAPLAALARRVNVQSALIGAVLGVLVASLGPSVVRVIGAELEAGAYSACALCAVTLVIRALYAGSSLRLNVTNPSMGKVLFELVLVSCAWAFVLKLPGIRLDLRPGLALVTTASVSACYMSILFRSRKGLGVRQ